MSAFRSAACLLRSLRRFSSLQPPSPPFFLRLTTGWGGSAPTAAPTGRNHNQHEHHSVEKFPPLLAPPSIARGWTAASRGTSSLRPTQRKQRAEEFCTRACPPQEQQDGAADSSLSRPSLSVCIRCCKRDADILSEALLCFGASSASMDELSDLDDTDEICITSIFTDGQDVHMCISSAAKSIGLQRMPNYEVTVSRQFDWINNLKETFNPIYVTDGLWVVPEWKSPPDIQATNIILNPGMAFGTGEHPTTKLCLLLLHGSIKGGENFLDYGTGSGVLGIASVKMGVALSVGVDIDPMALSSARQNIVLNEIEPERMILYLVPKRKSDEDQIDNKELHAMKEKFDIIIANILLNPLLELADEIVSYGKPGAVIGVSGIISEQIPQVKERYSEYLKSISISEMDGWACLAGIKRCTL